LSSLPNDLIFGQNSPRRVCDVFQIFFRKYFGLKTNTRKPNGKKNEKINFELILKKLKKKALRIAH